MDNRVSKRSRRFDRALLCYSCVVRAVEAYCGAVLASSCVLFFVALTLSGKIPSNLELGPLAFAMAPVLAWVGLAGMAIIAALAVPRFVAPLGVDIEGKEAEWAIWGTALTLLATIVYSLLFPNFLVAVALGLWYFAAFLFFNEEAAEGIIALLF